MTPGTTLATWSWQILSSRQSSSGHRLGRAWRVRIRQLAAGRESTDPRVTSLSSQRLQKSQHGAAEAFDVLRQPIDLLLLAGRRLHDLHQLDKCSTSAGLGNIFLTSSSVNRVSDDTL